MRAPVPRRRYVPEGREKVVGKCGMCREPVGVCEGASRECGGSMVATRYSAVMDVAAPRKRSGVRKEGGCGAGGGERGCGGRWSGGGRRGRVEICRRWRGRRRRWGVNIAGALVPAGGIADRGRGREARGEGW